MELAAYAIQNKADSVTVLGRSDVPFKQTLGEDIGKMWKQVSRRFQYRRHFFFVRKDFVLPYFFTLLCLACRKYR